MSSRFLLLLFVFSFSGANCSEKTNSNHIAVVDLKEVALKSKAGKDIERQIASINDEAKKDFLDLESKIKSMESNKKTDSDAQKIEDIQFILYNMVNQKKHQIAEAYKVAISLFDGEIKKIIKKISKEKGIKVVIASDAVVYRDENCLDITKEVTKDVDISCPSVKVELKEQKQKAIE